MMHSLKTDEAAILVLESHPVQQIQVEFKFAGRTEQI